MGLAIAIAGMENSNGRKMNGAVNINAKPWTSECIMPLFPQSVATTSFLNVAGGGGNQMIMTQAAPGAGGGGGFLSNLGGITPITFANTTITAANRPPLAGGGGLVGMGAGAGAGGAVCGDPMILMAGEMK